MKFSEQWLREWVNPSITTEQLIEELTMAGLEVDSAEPAAPEFSGVLVGLIKKVAPHPDADRLRIVDVDVGIAEPLSIVCGAPNVYEGMLAPVAVVGAVLPGRFKIKKSTLRGVPSAGMMCSAKELGLAEEAEGLMDLKILDAAPGTNLREAMHLDDTVIEVDLTPNRGDCFSVKGIATDVGVLTKTSVKQLEPEKSTVSIKDTFPIEVKNTEACPRYLGRIIKNVDANAQTPFWMQEKLRRGGIRSLGPLVDVTNYVMLELGQPMHAFDLARLEQGIVVRNAHKNEKLTLLDGSEISLKEDTLVIADHKKALAIAGVMGGEDSGISATTTDLFLECAFFSPEFIAGKARQYGLHTDSSHRFERGVDFALQQHATERATALLVSIVGGEVGPVTEVVDKKTLPKKQPILLRQQQIKRVLGLDIKDVEVEDILTRLGMQLEKQKDGWQVLAPPYRFDVEIEVDLLEELGRIYGYNQLPAATSHNPAMMRPVTEKQVTENRIQSCLVDRGYQEVICYSFVDPVLQQQVQAQGESIALANPLSSEMSVMRTSMLSGLIKTLQYNLARQQSRVRIFETGLCFIKQGAKLTQNKMLAGLVSGSQLPRNWSTSGVTDAVDFFDMKGDLEALFAFTCDTDSFVFVAGNHPSYHPGQCAEIRRNSQHIGWVGGLHPAIAKDLDLGDAVFAFELNLNQLLTAQIAAFAPISKYPSIRRDIAIVVDEMVTSDDIKACISLAAKGLLKKLELFDVYRGSGIETGRKSLALGLILQDSSSTLTDKKVDAVMGTVISQLHQEYQATLRE